MSGIRWTALFLATLAVAGCARGRQAREITSPGPAPQGIVVRIDTGGGFEPPDYILRDMPEVSVYSDGRAVTQGPQAEVFPPPALPSLIEHHLTTSGVERIREAARQAGLNGPDRRYRSMGVMDAPTTTFVYVDSAGRHETSAYALGIDSGVPPDQREPRAKLEEFRDKMSSLASWLGDDVSGDEAFEPAAMRVYVMVPSPDDGPPDAGPRPRKPWPLDTPMDKFGAQGDTQDFYERCGVVRDADLAKMVEAARQTNTQTVWTSDGIERELVFRPLLPDERAACRTAEATSAPSG